MFGQESKIKVAVLEERVKIHEEMVERVDAAIQTLSETNQNICKMLAVHDERLDQCIREDVNIVEKVGKIEVKMEELFKFRWMAAGIIAFAVFLVPIATNFVTSVFKANIENVRNK